MDKVTFNDGTTTYRLIDYKTGKDVMKFSNISDLFNKKSDRPKAILQLFLYANIFAQEYPKETGSTGEIKILPMIYKLRELAVKPLDFLKYGKINLIDYKQESNNGSLSLNDEFLSTFKTYLEELLNKENPLKQVKDYTHCGYCNFKDICGV